MSGYLPLNTSELESLRVVLNSGLKDMPSPTWHGTASEVSDLVSEAPTRRYDYYDTVTNNVLQALFTKYDGIYPEADNNVESNFYASIPMCGG